MSFTAPEITLFQGNRPGPVPTVGRFYLYSRTRFTQDNVLAAGYKWQQVDAKEGMPQVRVQLFYVINPEVTDGKQTIYLEHLVDFGDQLPQSELGPTEIIAEVMEATDTQVAARALADWKMKSANAVPDPEPDGNVALRQMATTTTTTTTSSTSNAQKDSP